jgi:hypothetical protein
MNIYFEFKNGLFSENVLIMNILWITKMEVLQGFYRECINYEYILWITKTKVLECINYEYGLQKTKIYQGVPKHMLQF